jgi:cysteine-rich repeat protein
MRALTPLLMLMLGCGARTPLSESDAGGVDVPLPLVDRPVAADVGADVGVGFDRTVTVDLGTVDRPVPPPPDRPAVCGDGVVGGAEECDRGADNGPTDAFTLSQPGRPAVVVRPHARMASASAFYAYHSASAHTGFEDVGLANHILYVDTAAGTLSLVYVAGRDGDLGLMPEQPDATLQLNWLGVPAGALVAVSDDDGELRAVGGGRFEGRWSFHNNTDGGAIQGLPWDQAWRIVAQTVRADGVTRQRFIGFNGTPSSLTLRDDVVITHRFGDLCREDCRRPRCGDNRLDAGERCDDGNAVDGDGCTADCQRFN